MKTLKLFFLFSFSTFNFQFTFGQQWCWAHDGKVNIKANDYASPVATNRYGSAYITGQFENLIIFGSDTLYDAHDNTYIVKYNSNGNVLWAKNPKTSGMEASFGYAVVSDAEDNAYITGTADSTMVFGTDTLQLSNGPGGFFVKYNPSGQVLWAMDYSGTALAIDKKGNICLVSAGGSLYKFNSNGKVFSHMTLAGVGNVNNISVDSLGNIYATGLTDTASKLGVAQIPFITKYDSNGKELWLHTASVPVIVMFNPNGEDMGIGNAVVTDKAGSVYMTGYFEDTLKFGPYTLTSPNSGYALFLVKYNSTGKLLWAKQTEGKYSWRGTSLSKDKYDNIYLAGSGINDDTLSLGGKIFTLSPPCDASFILKVDTSGKVLEGSVLRNGTFTYSPQDFNNGLAIDSSAQFCYLTGSFQGSTIICAGDTLYDGAGQASYIAKWASVSCSNSSDTAETGVNEITGESEQVKVYPNPNNGVFTLQTNSQQPAGMHHIEVYNMLGEKVYSQLIIDNSQFIPKESLGTINLANQSNGIYFYRVTDETGNLIGNGKFIIEK